MLVLLSVFVHGRTERPFVAIVGHSGHRLGKDQAINNVPTVPHFPPCQHSISMTMTGRQRELPKSEDC